MRGPSYFRRRVPFTVHGLTPMCAISMLVVVLTGCGPNGNKTAGQDEFSRHVTKQKLTRLIADGANLDRKDPVTGLTPLMEGVMSCDPDTVVKLLNKGATAGAAGDEFGRTALHAVSHCNETS